MNKDLALYSIVRKKKPSYICGRKHKIHGNLLKQDFNAFCIENNITQSMSKARCPYDNAPMERYFNSLNHELIYHYHFKSDEEIDKAINDYAYLFYNHKRPHTYNNGLTPFEKRYTKVL
jgi:transposase InsO family protein